MKVDEVYESMDRAGLGPSKPARLKNDTGWQIRLGNKGPVVNVFDNGTVNVQGQPGEREKIASILGLAGKAATVQVAPAKTNVFVVYGHDEGAKTELEAMLRRWGLEPLLLDQLPSEGQTIIEKLEKYQASAEFGIVLATPDDEGHQTGKPAEKAHRARQNVVLELGMLLQVLGRSKVAILLKNVQTMERPSDIQGLIYIPFSDSVNDAKLLLAKEMVKQGFNINISKL